MAAAVHPGEAGPGAGGGDAPAPPAPPARLTVVYDEQCALCRRCRAWLEVQPTYLPVSFAAAGSRQARRLWGGLPWLGEDLVVVGDAGQAWIGPGAFLVCLWATVEYRPWAFTLSGPSLAPMAERFFPMVSHQRGRLGGLAEHRCADGRCRHRPPVGQPPP